LYQSFHNYLPIFGLFLALNLLSQGIIKVGISKMIIDLSANEIVKDSNLVAINISSNIGSFIPSIIFLFVLSDLFDLNHWNMFFLIGVLSSLPMLLSIIFLKDFGNSFKKKKELQNEAMNSPKASPFNFIFLFLSYLLIWSDKLYEFPFSSWILTKFGQQSFNLYSISYIVFILLNISGWIIGQKISKRENRKLKMFISEKKKTSALDSTLIQEKLMFSFKIKKRKKIIIITVGIYIFLTFVMAFSDFFLMMIVLGIIQVLAGIFLLNYISLMMTIVNNGKHKTFLFQCLKLAYAFSCVIFIPLGTYFSDFIPIETLILIAGMLSALALAPLILLKVKPKKMSF
jgi:MFS family permease